MSRIKAAYGLIIISLMFITISCSNGDGDGSVANYELTYATSADASSGVLVGETINILVSFRVTNGCGQFGRFVESGNGLTRVIEIEARYEGLICTQDLPSREATYEYTPNSPGEYVFSFMSGPDLRFEDPGPDKFITVSVLVTEK